MLNSSLLTINITKKRLKKSTIKKESMMNKRSLKIHVFNELGKFLVKIFFGKIWKVYIVFFWIILYAIFYFYCNDAIKFINQVGLFLVVFILGKFLKDGLGIFFNVAGKK